MTSTVSSPGASRLAWVDVAKSAAIFLVVFYHVGYSAAPELLPGGHPLVIAFWKKFTALLLPVRMPLFFFVSGLLAINAIKRPLSQVWRPRYADLLWPYLLWSVAYSYVGALRANPDNPMEWVSMSLHSIPYGGNAYWFLSVLTLFFFTARLFKHQLVAATSIAAVFFTFAPLIPSLLEDYTSLPTLFVTNIGRVSEFALWYFLGLILAQHKKTVANLLTPRTTVFISAAFLIISIPHYYFGVASSIHTSVYQMLGILGVSGFIGVSIVVAKHAGVARTAALISSRTLPVYVIHPMLLVPVILAMRALKENGVEVLIPWWPLQTLVIPVVTILLFAVSLWVHRFCERIGLSFLFRFPILKRRVSQQQRVSTHVEQLQR